MLRANFQALMKKYNIRVRDSEAGADDALPPDRGRAPDPAIRRHPTTAIR